jgi:hypothetical protein
VEASRAVIRDEEGRLIMAKARGYNYLADALMGEFLAARDGLDLTAQHGMSRVVLESDNLALVNMLQANLGDCSVVFGLWQEIQELSRSFNSVVFSYVHREDNGAAHVCASLPSSLEPELFWVDNFPMRLVDASEKDCNSTLI